MPNPGVTLLRFLSELHARFC